MKLCASCIRSGETVSAADCPSDAWAGRPWRCFTETLHRSASDNPTLSVSYAVGIVAMYKEHYSRPVVHGAIGCGQKNFLATVAVPPAPVRVPSQRPLAPSVASITSVANDNEMILRAVYRSPGICLTAEENPRKPQLMKGLCDQSSPQIGSLSSK